MKRLLGLLLLSIIYVASFAQAHVMIQSGVKAVASGDVQLVSEGDIRNDGQITSSGTSTWNFKGTSLQRLTCLALGGCPQNYTVQCTPGSYTSQFMNVNLANAAGMKVETNAKIDGIHTFTNGICNIEEGVVWLSTAGSFASNNNTKFYATTGHGMLQQPAAAATFYPIGTTMSSANFAPAELTNSGTADQFGIRIYDSVYAWFSGVPGGYSASYGNPIGTPLNNHRVTKTWIVNECVVGGGNVDVKLYWQTPHEYFDFDRTNCQVMYWDFATNFWDMSFGFAPAIASPISGTNWYQFRNYTNAFNYPYRPMWVEDILRFLPVSALDLNVRKDNHDAIIEWRTTNEFNVNHYEVMFSTTGNNFEKIGQQVSHGDGSYTYDLRQLNIDQYIRQGTRRLFYQIKAVNNSGELNYSQIRSLVISSNNTWGIQFYPNPADHFVFIKASGLTNGAAEIKVVNNIGQVIMQKTSSVQDGLLNETINVSSLPGGIYNVLLLNNGNMQMQKMLVMH